jgi:hypothetical protein
MSPTIPFPEYWKPVKTIDVRLGALRYEAQVYDNYPLFQREKVWPSRMKQSLIDSILRGFPIPELLANWNEHRYWIVDGQQRLSTILEYFADGFPTAHLKEDPCLQPIEPNKRYSRLSPQARDLIDNYTLRISVMENVEESELGALFRRLQHQQSLMLAEKLWTFSSETNKQAAELTTHPFWQTMYGGRPTRKRPYLASLYLLCLELASGFTNLTTPCLRDTAAGTQDERVTSSLIATIRQRMKDLAHLFDGTIIQSLKEIVPAYQALILLEKSDCDVAKSARGCLSSWFAQVRQASLQARKTYGQIDMLSKMVYSRYQLQFWEEELPKMRASNGICIIDRKRSFSRKDREIALEKQGGLCPPCGQPITLSDIGHHVILHAKGGPTTPENCIIVHDACHTRLHALPGTEWEVLQEAA